MRRPVGVGRFDSWAFSERSQASGLVPSMGTIDDCCDIAVIEFFWGRMQTGLPYLPQVATCLGLADTIFECLEIFFDRTCRRRALGLLTRPGMNWGPQRSAQWPGFTPLGSTRPGARQRLHPPSPRRLSMDWAAARRGARVGRGQPAACCLLPVGVCVGSAV